MFNIGDLVVYSSHGICRISDICEKTFLETTETYYVLHPMEAINQLSISIPVDNEKVTMLALIEEDEAHDLLESFKEPGVKWIDNPHQRVQRYSNIVDSANRLEIAKVVNTLMRNELELKRADKKVHDRDHRLLYSIQKILFKEMAISLGTTMEDINNRVLDIIKTSEKVSM
ncbi:CarD family transcriptional regulator [Alteribacillus iranensis]|uniref:Transcriptional regulator, CarD family n=1 Tax=Alteribacillus iranensis TaxID=930128 RepID=A0A1I2BVA3_9BACI|nr:CarD family transcriptional regulator [Alteribacillus iranensis]SFE59240.1 transcriptional regulator, CarD family [Alteribacillus iranensis]